MLLEARVSIYYGVFHSTADPDFLEDLLLCPSLYEGDFSTADVSFCDNKGHGDARCLFSDGGDVC